MRPALLLLFCCGIFALPCLGKSTIDNIDREIKEHDKELKNIRTSIDEGQSKLKLLKKEERDVLKQMDQLDENLTLTHSLLRNLSHKETMLNEQRKLLEADIAALIDSLDIKTVQMEKRLRAIYKKGQPGIMEAFLSAQDLAEGFSRLRYFNALNKSDKQMLERLHTAKQEVEARKIILENKIEETRQVQIEKTEERELLTEQKQARGAILNEIKSEKSIYEKLVEDLRESRKAISELITALEKRKKEAINEAKQGEIGARVHPEVHYKGALVWPTEGKVVTRFGIYLHPVFKTKIPNNGIDIEAPEGQAVVAVSEGTVIYISQLRGMGKIIMIEHEGGYYSIYSHLSDIIARQKQQVEAGQLIGRVGETGSFEGTKLHFEFRKGKEALNPETWLPKRR